MNAGLRQEGRVIEMPSSPLCEAEYQLNFTVLWNRRTGDGVCCHLSATQTEALVNELAELRQKVTDNWSIVEDVAIGSQMECVVCGGLKPCMCDKK